MSSSTIFLVNKRPSVVSVDGALDVHGAPVVLGPPGQPNDHRECPREVINHPNVQHLIELGWIDVESGHEADKRTANRKATASGDPQGQSKDMLNMDAPEPPPHPLAGNPPGNTAPANEQLPWNANQDAKDPPPHPMAGNPPGLTAPPSPDSDEEEGEEDDGKGGKKKTMSKKKTGRGGRGDDDDNKRTAQPGSPQHPASGMYPTTGQMATGQNQVSMAPSPVITPEQQSALRRQTAPNIDDAASPMQPGTPEAVRAANAVRRNDGSDHHFADAADATTAKLGMQQASGPTGGYAGTPANADTAGTDRGQLGGQQPAASDARKVGAPGAAGAGDDVHHADAADATASKIGQPTIAKGGAGNTGNAEADAKYAKEQEEMEKKLAAEEEAKKKSGLKGVETPKSSEKDVSKGHEKDKK